MDIDDILLDDLLKRLHLANARRGWRDLVCAPSAKSGPTELQTLVSEEVAHRRGPACSASDGPLPFLKTIDEFDFTYQSAPPTASARCSRPTS